MIIEPTPTSPRSPLRRALRVVCLTVPPLLLCRGRRRRAGSARVRHRATPEPSQRRRRARRVRNAHAAGAPARGRSSPGLPDRGCGPGRSCPCRRRSLRLAAATGLPIAVAGYLTDVRGPATCAAAEGDTRRLLSPLCERVARLIAADRDGTDPGAHLHVRIPPGVRLPPAFEDAGPDDPMPVVIVGRAEDPGAGCTTSARGCGERLVADLVSWADGAPFDPGPVFDAGLELPPSSVAYRRLDEAKALAAGWVRHDPRRGRRPATDRGGDRSGRGRRDGRRPQSLGSSSGTCGPSRRPATPPGSPSVTTRRASRGWSWTRPPARRWRAGEPPTRGLPVHRCRARRSAAWPMPSRRVAQASPPTWSRSPAGSAPGRTRRPAPTRSRGSPAAAAPGGAARGRALDGPAREHQLGRRAAPARRRPAGRPDPRPRRGPRRRGPRATAAGRRDRPVRSERHRVHPRPARLRRAAHDRGRGLVQWREHGARTAGGRGSRGTPRPGGRVGRRTREWDHPTAWSGRCGWCSPGRRTWRPSILPRRRSSVRPACDPRLRSGTSAAWRPTAPPSPGPSSSPARARVLARDSAG